MKKLLLAAIVASLTACGGYVGIGGGSGGFGGGVSFPIGGYRNPPEQNYPPLPPPQTQEVPIGTPATPASAP